MEINVNEKTREWLYEFAKLHNLTTPEQAVDKLISCYQAWNSKWDANCTKNDGGKE
ncbi:MAG: hypothetical protein ACLKAN_13540 [Alkaliphilus sp.]